MRDPYTVRGSYTHSAASSRNRIALPMARTVHQCLGMNTLHIIHLSYAAHVADTLAFVLGVLSECEHTERTTERLPVQHGRDIIIESCAKCGMEQDQWPALSRYELRRAADAGVL